MKFTIESSQGTNLIRAYGEDRVRIGDRTLTRSCVIASDRIIEDWPATHVELLVPEDFEPVFALQPEVVVLGTGHAQRFPSLAVRGAFAQRALGLEVMDMGAACRTYNVLLQDQRRVVAALIIG